MTNFNPFLISQQKNVRVNQISPERWCFDVGENGELSAAFLQFDQNLDLDIVLSESGAKCDIKCAYLSNNNNKLKVEVKVLHKHSNTISNQQIRGLVTDRAQVDFCGTIHIPHDSQKCDGKQNHRAVVLSPTASVLAVPQLEIWADDVQCVHGSAVGPLDPEMIFYLQTRGLNQKEATHLLLQSFLGDFMPTEFDQYIKDWMDQNV